MNRAAKTIPIKLKGAGYLVYNDIAEFMGTKRIIVTVNRDKAKTFVNDGEEDELTLNEGGADLEATVDVLVRLRDSTYCFIQSAISFLYWHSGIERPEELKGGFFLYFKGSRKKGRQLNQDIGLEISEGKKTMSQEVFIFLAKKFSREIRKSIFLLVSLYIILVSLPKVPFVRFFFFNNWSSL